MTHWIKREILKQKYWNSIFLLTYSNNIFIYNFSKSFSQCSCFRGSCVTVKWFEIVLSLLACGDRVVRRLLHRQEQELHQHFPGDFGGSTRVTKMGSLWDCNFLPCCIVGALLLGIHVCCTSIWSPSCSRIYFPWNSMREASLNTKGDVSCCSPQWPLSDRAVTRAVLGTAAQLWTDWGLVWTPVSDQSPPPTRLARVWPAFGSNPVLRRDSLELGIIENTLPLQIWNN